MNSSNNIILRISCKDQKGIVAKVSNFIAQNNGNIIDSQQHSTGLDAHFFMRLAVEASSFEPLATFKNPQGALDLSQARAIKTALKDSFKSIADEYKMDYNFSFKKKRLGILVSKYDHCLYDLLLRHKYSELNVDIPVIISNHPDLEHVAKSFNIPFHYVRANKAQFFDKSEDEARKLAKQEQEQMIIKILQENNVDFIAMARYMQILSGEFINSYPYQIINVHHGFLPAFKGAKPYHQAHDKGVKIIGATSHYATEDLDMGPIIAQDVIAVDHRDEVEDYLAKGRDIETTVFAKAIKAHAEDKIIRHEARTIVFY